MQFILDHASQCWSVTCRYTSLQLHQGVGIKPSLAGFDSNKQGLFLTGVLLGMSIIMILPLHVECLSVYMYSLDWTSGLD